MFCNELCLLSSARTGQLQIEALLVSPACSGQGLPQHPTSASHLPPGPTQPRLLSSGSKAYLRPLRELPLGPTGLVLAGFPLHGPGQPGCLAEVIVDGAVEARCQHLPAAHGAVLEALAAGPGALTPPAGLPPPQAGKAQRNTSKGEQGHGVAGMCLHTRGSLTQQLLLGLCSSHLSKCAGLETSFALNRQFRSLILPLFLLTRACKVFLV